MSNHNDKINRSTNPSNNNNVGNRNVPVNKGATPTSGAQGKDWNKSANTNTNSPNTKHGSDVNSHGKKGGEHSAAGKGGAGVGVGTDVKKGGK